MEEDLHHLFPLPFESPLDKNNDTMLAIKTKKLSVADDSFACPGW